MSRFDWKRAVVNLAHEVEASSRSQRMFPERAAKFSAERDSKASYAAWICRSYNRKGVRPSIEHRLRVADAACGVAK